MTTHHLGRIVVGSLTAGLVIAPGLVVGPLAGSEEHVITGTVLLGCAAGWALVATLSMLWTTQPQRWALMPAGFMGLAGAALLALAPGDVVIDALGWVWPPLLLVLLAATGVRVHVDLHSRTRSWLVYPLLGVYALLTREMPRANRPRSTTATRLKRCSRESHDFGLDAGERTLLKSFERGEWTTVAGFRAAKARHARSATATLRRLRKT